MNRRTRTCPHGQKRQDEPAAHYAISGPYFLLTAFLSSTPGVNFATLRAAILITAPVWGLRPLRALRCDTANVPKPTRVTRSPFLRAAVTPSMRESIATA